MSDLALDTSTANALSSPDPWALIPSLGNLAAYIGAVHRVPLLTQEQEIDFGRRLRDQDDLTAAHRLIVSHLRLVVSIARNYLGYGLPHSDLIQEGNVGLMKAVKRFNPDHGVRLVSYAVHWIKAEIHEYILKNWRMVKVASTKAQRKLFFNLRSMKQSMKSLLANEETHRTMLTQSEVDTLAKTLDVKHEEVLEMETRLSSVDVALEPQANDGDEAYAPIAHLADYTSEPTRVLEAKARDWLTDQGIALALESLDARSRRVVEQRWLKVKDDGSGGMTPVEPATLIASASRISRTR